MTTVLATVVAMFFLDWRLTLFALALIPVFVFMTRRVGRARQKIAKVRQESMADISSLVQESLSVSGILLGKTMGRAGALATRFESESERLADLEVRSRMTGRWMMASIQTTFAVMPALVYLFAGHYAGAVSIGTVIAFTTLQARLFFPVGSLLGVSLEVQTSLALFDRVFEYLDQPVDIEAGTRTLKSPRGHVAFDQVWFRYDDAAWTLQDVSFEVPAGTKTALVGETGSGKTTAGYLVARLYDVTEGSVAIDGVDVRDLTFSSLADAVGVVSQETYLFHATIRENLRFARPEATDEEVEEAARAAQIHGLIATLPEGYETVVGERGYRFSGGERQRIAIARTILRNPPILVLDEATSALDTQTERAVQEALERLAEGRTTIAIAHRLSTVRDAAQIEDPWEAFTTLVRNGCESMAADAAKRRMWTVASDEASAYAADAKQEMHADTAVVVERAHAAGMLRPDFGGTDMGSLMCGLAAVIDQTRMPGDWRRIVEFALDGLRVR